MSDPKKRAGAIMSFMSRDKQLWTPFPSAVPYDEIVFPHDAYVKEGAPNEFSHKFYDGSSRTVDSVIDSIDPASSELKKRVKTFLDICLDVHNGFVALGISRLLPRWLQFLVKDQVERLYKYAALTVRDAQHAVIKLGYTAEDLLKNCPKAPETNEEDPSIRRLKAVLTHPIGDYAVQPRDATFAAHGVTAAHYITGGAYTVGATQNISTRLTSMCRSFGGEALIDATVRSIIVENGRAVGVRVSNTDELEECSSDEELAKVPVVEIRAKNVVCATSVYNLYNKFLPQDLPIVKKFQDPTQRSVRQSNGHVFLFCKIKGSPEEIGLPDHNLWYFNGYDLDEAFDKYFNDPTKHRPPTVYIGFPCTKDVTWTKRFPGISNCILISDGLYEWFEKWADKPVRNRGEDYLEFKDQLTRHLMDILCEFVPQVKGRIEYYQLGTPLSEETFLASWRGGSYGTKCVTDMFAPINRNWTTTPYTEIPGLYLAGSDAFLPSVTGAMYGGCLCAAAVLGKVGSIRLGLAILSHLAKRLRDENPKLSRVEAFVLAVKKFME
jgi:all-trans-retinol 13,14-reductase